MKEHEIWDHYLGFLTEALQQPESVFKPFLSGMKRRVAEDCTREELRDMMVALFEPATVMQGLEQWECMMDLLLYTGMDKFAGESRYDYFTEHITPYTDLSHGGRDNRLPNTHIYDLSGLTQDRMHIIFNFGPLNEDSPHALEMVIRDAKLQRNAELQMLLGDLYQKVGQFDKGVQVFKNIRLNKLADDRSIDDAIRYTDYIVEFNKTGILPPRIL